MTCSLRRNPSSVPSLLMAALVTLAGARAFAGVAVTGGVAPGATSWPGAPIAASVANPSGETSIAEGFSGTTVTSYAETFTVPVGSSYRLDRICLYVGGGTGTSGAAPLTLNLYDLGGQAAPNPSGYLAANNRLGGGAGLVLTYTTQPNGVLQLDFTGADRVTLVAGRLYAFEIAGTSGTNPLGWLRGVTDTSTNGAAYRNRSWINGSNARDFAMAVYGTATATPPTASTVDAAVTHQTIDGFGAGTAFLDAGIQRLTDAQMDALYGTGPTQMGLTLIRVRISPNGISDWGDPIANGQKAHARGAKILASPWTPPAALKDNGSTILGSLLPAKYPDYVAHLNSFTDAMAAAGAPVSVVSLQNEPDFDPDYEGCLWTAAQFRTFCRDFAGGLKVPVMMPESYDFDPTVSDATLNDPLAAANVDYVGGHLYGATIRDYPLAHSLGKRTWMTEYLINDQTIGTAVATAQQVQDCLTVGNMSAYIWWKCIGNANGLLNAAGVLQKRAFVFGQFSRFVRPGDVRLDVPANDSSLGLSAFRNPTTGVVAIVAVNNTGAAIQHTFNLQGIATATVTPWVTSATESLAVQAPVAVSGGAFTYNFPATTVVTFVTEPPAAAPTIAAQPRAFHVPAGYTATLAVTATGTAPFSYQWKKDGVALGGATSATLSLPGATLASAGNYTVTVANALGSVTSDAAALVVGTSAGRVPAISMRARVGTGAEILVPGLVVGGAAPQSFLVRALGPKLGDFGIDAATRLADPLLKITLLDGTLVAQNDNWNDNANAAAIATTAATLGAQPLTAGSKDAVLLTSLAPGIYTPQISGVGATTGVSLVEFYNVDAANKVPALAMRARVGTGSEILVPGLVVEGGAPKMFLIRALGPKLGDFGIDAATRLGDPLLKITLLDGTLVAQNDNWEESANAALLPAITTALGAQPLAAGSKDAVLLIALPPGIYTPQISGVGATSGVSLVEFYNVE